MVDWTIHFIVLSSKVVAVYPRILGNIMPTLPCYFGSQSAEVGCRTNAERQLTRIPIYFYPSSSLSGALNHTTGLILCK